MHIHETEPQRAIAEEKPYVPPDLEEIARIEGAGPMKQADWGSMPAWVRRFGIGVFVATAGMAAIGLISSWLR
ncbi:hypothetical protein [Paenibacillus flagellatus]|uniref:Uncharacterized protein n=1 Tax=Paenibacillus flagellatus TaxID=2211139 RepID=A0A2V5K8L5_9BACL|nr:hypothetical protein [Paenibacillus flagellatus]PYI55831.1 hypothetical protein DLM86_08935 [Paenibacillus flagellatus]